MAEQREIVIRIINEESQGTGNAKGKKKRKKEKSKLVTDKKNNYLDTALMDSLLQSSAKKIGLGMLSEVKYEIDKYYRLTDNYLGKQNMNIALGLANETFSFGRSVVTAFKVSGPVGAAITALFSAANIGVTMYKNNDQQRMEVAKLDTQLSFNRQRAGFSLTAGVTGENK